MRSFADVFRLPAPLKRPERVVVVLEGTVRLVSARIDAARVWWTWDVGDRSLTVPAATPQNDPSVGCPGVRGGA